MATFLLDTPLRNWRGHTESFEAYRARLRKMHEIVRRRLKGQMRHVSAKYFGVPYDAKDDEAVNEQIRRGIIRDHKIVTTKAGQMHFGVYKVTTYRPLKNARFA